MSLSSTLGTYIAANHTRAVVPFSQFSTRRIQYYGIVVVGYDIVAETGWEVSPNSDFDSWRETFISQYYDNWGAYPENLESYKSILYPMIRGITNNAELFYVGFPEVESGDTFLTVGLAQDTTMDAQQDFFVNNTKSLIDQVADSIADFNWDSVDVVPLAVVGWNFAPMTMGGALPNGMSKVAYNPAASTTKLAKSSLNLKKR